MAGPILPPNTAMVDSRNRPTPEWYRYFTNIQRGVNDTPGNIDDASLTMGALSDVLDLSSVEDLALMSQAVTVPVEPEDQIYPLFLEQMVEEVIPPVASGMFQEEADLRYAPLGASASLGIRTVTATLTPLGTDYTILCDATGGAITVNLPAAAASATRVINVKKIDASANAVTIDPAGAELIDGSATFVISAQYQNAPVQCDGSAWWVL